MFDSATASFEVRQPLASFPIKSRNPAFWCLLREMGYTDIELTEVDNLIRGIPLLVISAKYKGVRFDVSDVENEEIITLDGDVMIFWGRQGQLFYNLVQSFVTSLTGGPI